MRLERVSAWVRLDNLDVLANAQVSVMSVGAASRQFFTMRMSWATWCDSLPKSLSSLKVGPEVGDLIGEIFFVVGI